jgi:hypothetical protein
MIVNGEKERIWKEAFLAFFRVMFRYMSGRTEENHNIRIGIIML